MFRLINNDTTRIRLWIYGFYYDKFNSTDETIKDLHNILKRKKIIKLGQLVINIGSMPIMEKGMTNMLKMSKIN